MTTLSRLPYPRPSGDADTALVIRTGPNPGVYYRSGLTVYDEALRNGRLVGRYWSAVGAIRPDHALESQQGIFDLLPTDAFHLRIDDSVLDRAWRWITSYEIAEDGPGTRRLVIELAHAGSPVTVKIHTSFDGSPFLVRRLELTNTGADPVSLSAVAPFAGLLWWVENFAEHLRSGANSVFSLGYYARSGWDEEGDFRWEPLRTGTKTIEGRMGRSGHGRPSFMLRNEVTGETFIGELAWSGNWRYDITVEQDDQAKYARLYVKIGPFAADPTLRVIDPGETIATPAVHIGHLHADLDGCVQALHRHIRTTVLPAQLPGKHQLIEANHRGYISDHEDEAGIKREIDMASAVGAEIFVIDAGWYGREPNRWAQNVGDWFAGPWLPNDLYPIIDHAHGKGLLFGLWVEIESIGANSTLLQEHPDWVLTRNGEPIGKGRHLDVANPVVAAWMEAELVRIIAQYKLDLFRLDYNTLIHEGGNRPRDGFIENTIWRHVEAIWGIFERLRQRFPEVIFENCASGGGRLDLGMLRWFQITEISDWMPAPRSLKILNGLSLHLPPEICLRTFGTEIAESCLYGDLDFQLRSCLFGHPILRGIAPTLDQIGEPRGARITHALTLYKEFIRPILPDASVFHHTPVLRFDGPEPWCILEYAAPDGSRAVVGVFRLNEPSAASYRFRPRGLRAGNRYRVYWDNTGADAELSGFELQRDGLEIRLESPLTSELLLIEAI
jgi:alpha-galactosidase